MSESLFEELHGLATEHANAATAQIDCQSAVEIARSMNAEDATVAGAVATQIEQIGAAIEGIVARMEQGGRLIYLGAGTSGRLGVLDASECPPTFSTDRQLVGWFAGWWHARIDPRHRAAGRRCPGGSRCRRRAGGRTARFGGRSDGQRAHALCAGCDGCRAGRGEHSPSGWPAMPRRGWRSESS